MSFIALIVAILCGIVLVLEIETGNLSELQVAGVGLIALVVAGAAPASFPWQK